MFNVFETDVSSRFDFHIVDIYSKEPKKDDA